MLNSITHLFTALTHEILIWALEEKLVHYSIFSIQTLCAVRNSGISLAAMSVLMAYNAWFPCVNGFVPPFPTFYELFNVKVNVNPRTYKLIIHTPTMIQGGGGGGVGWNPPWFFAALQYFEKILPFITSILKSLVIHAIWLAPSSAIYSWIASFFALNRIFFPSSAIYSRIAPFFALNRIIFPSSGIYSQIAPFLL